MRKVYNRFIVLIFFLVYSFSGISQTAENWTLNTTQTNSKEYIAREYITLKPGFKYTPTANTSFTAKIDPTLLFPPTENTYAKPDGTITLNPSEGGIVGRIAGQFSVSPTGGSSYTIPIECPVGINNIQPSIALVYNSQSGSGIAGWGWNISGLSSISRTPKTNYFDNISTSILWDNTSPFSLDGQRLIETGRWGTDSVEYHTEIESYSRIVAYNIQNWGPSYFKVYTKEGLTMVYGDSQNITSHNLLYSNAYVDGLTGTNAAKMAWNLVELSDNNGNYIQMEYVNKIDSNIGNVIRKIKYGANKVKNNTPNIILAFNYSKRPDEIQGFLSGKEALQQMRLSSIETSVDNEIQKKYQLDYTGENVSRLQSVTLFQNGSRLYNPLVFTYGTPDVAESNTDISFIRKDGDNEDKEYKLGLAAIDLDGDGIPELGDIYAENDIYTTGLGLSISKCFFDIHHKNNNWVAKYRFETFVNYRRGDDQDLIKGLSGSFGDFNANGTAESVYAFTTGYSVHIRIVDKKDDTVLFERSLQSGSKPPFMTIGNFIESPYSGLIVIHDDPEKVSGGYEYYFDLIRGTSAGVVKFPYDNNGQYIANYKITLPEKIESLQTVNLTNIALRDELWITLTNGTVLIVKDILNPQQIQLSLNIGKDDLSKIADINQDGLPDIIYRKNTNNWFVALNKGDYTFQVKELDIQCNKGPSGKEGDNIFFVDFNNDGLVDIVVGDEFYLKFGTMFNPIYKFSNTTWRFYLNNGNGSYQLAQTKISSEKSSYSVFADFLGKGSLNWVHADSIGNVYLTDLGYGINKNMLIKVSDNFSGDETIEYLPLSDYTEYDNLNDTENNLNTAEDYLAIGFKPFRSSSLLLTSQYNSGVQKMKYQYGTALMNWVARGFLGFRYLGVIDEANEEITFTKNSLVSSNYLLLPQVVELSKASQNPILRNRYKYNIINLGEKKFTSQLSMHKTENILRGFTNYIYYGYDSFGNIRYVDKEGYGITYETTYITYGKFGSWCDNKPTTVIVKKNTSTESFSRQTNYDYNEKGNQIKEIIDPNNENERTTLYSNFDTFGHAQIISSTANNITRTISVNYTPSGRFISNKTNIHGESTSYSWNEKKGLLNSIDDHLGTTIFNYNNLNVLTQVQYPTGIRAATALQWASPDNFWGAKYYSYKESSGTSPEYVWYNSLGQEIVRETFGLNNQRKRSFIEYYDNGKIKQISDPTFNTQAETWRTTYSYDPYGRVLTKNTPSGTINYEYLYSIIKTTSPEGERYIEIDPHTGYILNTEENEKAVEFIYHPSGLIKKAAPMYGQAIEMEYDLQGNRTKITDPDAGVIRSKYNGWGELLWEKQKIHSSTDSITTSYDYYSSGLIKNKIRNGEKTTYTYDSKYRLSNITIVGKHSQSFEYDKLDRIIKITDIIENNKTFVTSTEYDGLGRVKKVTYPSGYSIINQYDKYSHLVEVKDKNGSNIWKALDSNAMGQLTKTSQGGRETTFGFDSNGLTSSIFCSGIINMSYEFNNNGNLHYRQDNLTGYKESFMYDSMNRLTNWNISLNGVAKKNNSLSFDDSNGNIAKKSDLGSYSMNYGVNGKQHALTSISGQPGLIPSTAQNITYTDFKKVKSITEGTNTLNISYGVDEQRIKTVQTATNGSLTRYYLGGYEEEISGSNVRKLHYLGGGNGLAAIYVSNTQGGDTLYYTYTDYQGSLVALTLPSGTVKEKYAFDPWGNRRNPANWTQADTRTSFTVNRGYTMHEHLDAFKLINMNGRVYDPLTSMFLSPDPYVQAPENWLNYNRYGYCLNNPLKYTDPDGELWFLVPIIAGGIINWATNGADFTWEGLSYFGVGALAGASTLLAVTGVGAALVPALAGGITGGGNNYISQGFAGGNGNTWDGSNIDWGQVGIGATSGAITGYLGGQIAGKLTPYVSKYVSGMIGGPVVQDMLTQAVVQSTTGFTISTGWSLLNGDSFEDALGHGWEGFKVGLVTGTATGIVSGYQRAQVENIHPWTGKSKGLQYETKQVGHKYGEHKKDYPNMSHDDYLNMAKEIYLDPLSTKITYPSKAPIYPGETHYYNNGNLLRISPDGKFRSLYPN